MTSDPTKNQIDPQTGGFSSPVDQIFYFPQANIPMAFSHGGVQRGYSMIPFDQHQTITEGKQSRRMSPGEDSEDISKKREIRLVKNREAARECRKKKKEYVTCLENRVKLLESQNKTLIEELRNMKALYQQMTDSKQEF